MADNDPPMLEIPEATRGRWRARLGWLAFTLVVAAALIGLLSVLSGSLRVAAIVETLMLGAMYLLGLAAEGRLDRRSRAPRER